VFAALLFFYTHPHFVAGRPARRPYGDGAVMPDPLSSGYGLGFDFSDPQSGTFTDIRVRVLFDDLLQQLDIDFLADGLFARFRIRTKNFGQKQILEFHFHHLFDEVIASATLNGGTRRFGRKIPFHPLSADNHRKKMPSTGEGICEVHVAVGERPIAMITSLRVASRGVGGNQEYSRGQEMNDRSPIQGRVDGSLLITTS
jgi:hypothetical protein